MLGHREDFEGGIINTVKNPGCGVKDRQDEVLLTDDYL